MVVVGPHCRKTWQSKLDKEALLLGTFIVFEISIIMIFFGTLGKKT